MAGAGGISENGLPWSSGICDCFSDIPSCCWTTWCPCVTFGRTSEIIDEGSISCCGNASIFCMITLFTPCICLYTCIYRSRLRGKYGLQETPCNDCCVHFWCWSCALCQEYRELKNRGFDMHIGWQGNEQRKKRSRDGTVVEEKMKR